MEFGQFLVEMTLMPTSESVGLAGKVVDLEKLHRYRYFLDWTTIDFCLPEGLQGAQQAQKSLFSATERGSDFFRYSPLRKFDFSVFEFCRLNLTGMDDFRRVFRGGPILALNSGSMVKPPKTYRSHSPKKFRIGLFLYEFEASNANIS